MAKDCKPWARLFPLRKASPEPSELPPPCRLRSSSRSPLISPWLASLTNGWGETSGERHHGWMNRLLDWRHQAQADLAQAQLSADGGPN